MVEWRSNNEGKILEPLYQVQLVGTGFYLGQVQNPGHLCQKVQTVTWTIQLLPRTWNSLRIICKEYTENSQWRNSTTQLMKAYKQISMLPSQVPMLFTAGQFWPSKCLFLFVTHLKNKRIQDYTEEGSAHWIDEGKGCVVKLHHLESCSCYY